MKPTVKSKTVKVAAYMLLLVMGILAAVFHSELLQIMKDDSQFFIFMAIVQFFLYVKFRWS